MSDGAARFPARFPVVWHVIEAEGAGPWLAETGLLPAAALLELAGVAGGGANRDEFHRVPLGEERVAVLRPQLMADRWLVPTLAGDFAGRPGAWRAHINTHVFTWTERSRRDAFVRACARARSQSGTRVALPVVLALDTAALLGRHAETAFFARFNTGSRSAAARESGETKRPWPR